MVSRVNKKKGVAEMIDRDVLWETIHAAGGCDAQDEWSKGWDAAITEVLQILEEQTDVKQERAFQHHQINILTEEFPLITAPHGGTKRFELRKNDADYREGDSVTLQEWDGEKHTGNAVTVGIKYVMKNCPEHGLMDGYCILGW